jgi:subtilase family serine protease
MAISITRNAMMFLFPVVAMMPVACSSTNASTGTETAASASDEALDQAALAKITAAPFKDRCAAPTAGKLGAMHCLAKVRTSASGEIVPMAAPSGLTPTDLIDAYSIPKSTSTATVAIIDAQDDPEAEADLGVYRKQFGLPPCTTANGCFTKVNENGKASPLPTADKDWSGEIMLDIEMVSAACPTCKILLVEANQASTDDLGTAVNTAATMGATFISNSYGGSEDSTVNDADTKYYSNHKGIAVFASSGDNAYGTSFPASGSRVIGVGGTSLATSTSSRGWAETAWTSAGSGCSAFIADNAWQKGRHQGCSHKMVSDISAVADPNTGVAVYDKYGSGGWNVYGGTSVSSPLTAAIFAAAGGTHTSGQLIWDNHTTLFHDVTSGSNGTCKTTFFCTAGVGYDGPTGWGTPNGAAIEAFANK